MSTLGILAAAALGGSIPGSIQWLVSNHNRKRDLRVACRMADEELQLAQIIVQASLEFGEIEAAEMAEIRGLDLAEPMSVIRGEFDDALWKAMRKARGALWLVTLYNPGAISTDNAAFVAASNDLAAARDLLGVHT
jgi:hypothetical protein